jgi:hypothetical protein
MSSKIAICDVKPDFSLQLEPIANRDGFKTQLEVANCDLKTMPTQLEVPIWNFKLLLLPLYLGRHPAKRDALRAPILFFLLNFSSYF